MEFFSSDSDEDEEMVKEPAIENGTEAVHNATETDMSYEDDENEVIFYDDEENGDEELNVTRGILVESERQGLDEQMNILGKESEGTPVSQPPVVRKQLERRAICRKALGRLAANHEIRQIRKQSGEPAKHRQMGNTKSSRNRNIISVYREAQKISEKFHVDFLIHHACANKVRPYKDRKAYGNYAKMHKGSTLAKEHDDQFDSNYSMESALQNKEGYKLNETELMKASAGEASGKRLGKTMRARNRKIRFIYNLAAKISEKFTVDFIIHHACPNDTHPYVDKRAFGWYAKYHNSSPIGTKYTEQFVRGYAIAFESKKQKGKNTTLPNGSTLTELVMGSKSIIDKVILTAGVLKKKSKEPDLTRDGRDTIVSRGSNQMRSNDLQSNTETVYRQVTPVLTPPSTSVPTSVRLSISALYSWEDKLYCKVPSSNPESFLLVAGCNPVNPPKGVKIISLSKAPRINSGKQNSLTRTSRRDFEPNPASTPASGDSISTGRGGGDDQPVSPGADHLEMNDIQSTAASVARSVTPLTPPPTPVPSTVGLSVSVLYSWEDKLYCKVPRSNPESFLLVTDCNLANPPNGVKILSLAKAPQIHSGKEPTSTPRASTRASRESVFTVPTNGGAPLVSPGSNQLRINDLRSIVARVGRQVTPVPPPSTPVPTSVELSVSALYLWEDQFYCKVPQSNPESFLLVKGCNTVNPPKGVKILSLQKAPLLKKTVK